MWVNKKKAVIKTALNIGIKLFARFPLHHTARLLSLFTTFRVHSFTYIKTTFLNVKHKNVSLYFM